MPIGSVPGVAAPSVGNDVLPDERAEYEKFSMHHVGSVGRPMPSELWHYTNAESLLAILESGQIFSTQVSCLNDSRERRYFGELVLEAIKERMKSNADKQLATLHEVAATALSDPNIWSVGYFVTCFSEVEDDLSQWRGYGGSETSFSIGFQSEQLLEATNQQGNFLIPMNYDDATHRALVAEVIEWAEKYFLAGLARGRTNIHEWARSFLIAFSQSVEAFTCTIKHPKFAGEKERRISVYLKEQDRPRIRFRPKRTLLARHLPLDLGIDRGGKKLLPITRIFVGPSPGQKASRVAVADLLAQRGYDNVLVELSDIPFRTV